MNSGEIHALHYESGAPAHVKWEGGRIIEITTVSEKPDRDIWVAPPLVDLQINGYAGVDFQQDNITGEQLLIAARGLRYDGCGHFFLTLITDEWSRLLARLRHLRTLRDKSPELRDAIIGWHIEGPFLSDQPGFCGAHNPAHMRDPTLDDIRELRAATGRDRVMLTIAPERGGALEAIRLATELNMCVSLGHTDASAEVLRDAISAGATGFTHLGNGCPPHLHRHDNILWRACDAPGLTVSLIPDCFHVPPTPFRLLHKLIGGAIYYTTDAMAAAGGQPGRYRLGELELEVGPDQIVRQPGKPNFAGSALQPVQGVFRAARMLNCPWQECWRRFSEVPAQFIGFQNDLCVGSQGFMLVEPAEEAVRLPSIWNRWGD